MLQTSFLFEILYYSFLHLILLFLFLGLNNYDPLNVLIIFLPINLLNSEEMKWDDIYINLK